MDETTQPSKTTGMNPFIITALIAVIGIIAYMLFLNQSPTAPSETGTEETDTMEQPTTGAMEESTPDTMMNENDIVTVEIEAGSFYYSQKEIRVKQGQTVRINFQAVDMMHDFNIDELQ